MEYWSSGRLLVMGHNPYDRVSVLALQRQQGVETAKFVFVRNPPWTLWWMMPLGLLPLKAAWVLWMMTCTGVLVGSIHLCWRVLAGNDPAVRSLFLLWTVGFAPILACMMAGQIGLLLLLGMLLFLLWEKDHPFWAGFALILPLEKPHLIAPFLLVLLIQSIAKRNWRVMAGLTAATIAAMLPILLIDPQLFVHYRAGIAEENIGAEFIPTISGFLRALLFRDRYWVQFVPVFGGMIFGAWFYLRTPVWDWRRQGFVLLVGSVMVAPYGWFTDEAILLPVVLAAWLRIQRWETRPWATWLLLGGTVILFLMTMAGVRLTSWMYIWSVPLWGAWYWLSCRNSVDGKMYPANAS